MRGRLVILFNIFFWFFGDLIENIMNDYLND